MVEGAGPVATHQPGAGGKDDPLDEVAPTARRRPSASSRPGAGWGLVSGSVVSSGRAQGLNAPPPGGRPAEPSGSAGAGHRRRNRQQVAMPGPTGWDRRRGGRAGRRRRRRPGAGCADDDPPGDRRLDPVLTQGASGSPAVSPRSGRVPPGHPLRQGPRPRSSSVTSPRTAASPAPSCWSTWSTSSLPEGDPVHLRPPLPQEPPAPPRVGVFEMTADASSGGGPSGGSLTGSRASPALSPSGGGRPPVGPRQIQALTNPTQNPSREGRCSGGGPCTRSSPCRPPQRLGGRPTSTSTSSADGR